MLWNQQLSMQLLHQANHFSKFQKFFAIITNWRIDITGRMLKGHRSLAVHPTPCINNCTIQGWSKRQCIFRDFIWERMALSKINQLKFLFEEISKLRWGISSSRHEHSIKGRPIERSASKKPLVLVYTNHYRCQQFHAHE